MFFFFQAEDGIRDYKVTGVQTCALPISVRGSGARRGGARCRSGGGRMSILLDEKTRVIVQGFTGDKGTFHAKEMIAYGTNVVGGVTPGKGGTRHLGRPVFNTVKEAVADTGAAATLILVPAPFCADAIMEAADAGIRLVVTITDGVPAQDMMTVKRYLWRYSKERRTTLIGPNCAGVISAGRAMMGIMPGHIYARGAVGVVTRSGTLGYEAASQMQALGIGITTSVGIGGDPINGSSFVDMLALFEQDPETEAVMMIGEIGGPQEADAAVFVKEHMTKPVIGYVAGLPAPKGRRLTRDDPPFTAAELQDALRGADALLPTVTDRLNADVLATEPLRAKILANYGVGFNHIDVNAAKTRGLVVTNTPDVLTDDTADDAVMLMLMVARRAGEGERQVRAGAWTGWGPTHMLGTKVSGKTLGLVGLGRIGRAVARRRGTIAGAARDVYEREPQVPPELRTLENVVLLPHLGSATAETRAAMGLRALENLTAFFAGAPPRDRVV